MSDVEYKMVTMSLDTVSSTSAVDVSSGDVAATAVDDNVGCWNGTLLILLGIDTLITLVAAGAIATCIMWIAGRRSRRREERNKLANIIRLYYWESEDKIAVVLQVLARLRKTVVYRDVTELHVLAYKYRCQQGVYGDTEDMQMINASFIARPSAAMPFITILHKVEHLFDSLALQLPCQGKCSKKVMTTLGSTIFSLARSMALLWNDAKIHSVRRLVKYFVGSAGVEQFDQYIVSDEELETLVLSRVPYVSQLYLQDDRFVLRDVDIHNELKLDLRNKIRYVDTKLSRGEKLDQNKEKSLLDAYNNARDICLQNNFIHNKNNLPDLAAKNGEANKLGDCVALLRHLLRVMCISKHLRKLEGDDKFFQFLMHLHESLYTWTDASAMMEVIERSRTNIYTYLRGLTAEQILMDREFTKAKLEHVERELYRHVSYLTHKMVQQDKVRRQRFQQSRAEQDAKLRSVDSESSIYTMAMSASSFAMKRQVSQDMVDGTCPQGEPDLLPDRASLISSSSMYATAASLCSGTETTPLMFGNSLDLGNQHSIPNSLNSNDFFETAV